MRAKGNSKLVWRPMFWLSDCGHTGEMKSFQASLAGLVRDAAHDHGVKYPDCRDWDITQVNTKEEMQALRNKQPDLGAGLC